MTTAGVEFEMIDLNKTPCIDAALAFIEATRSSLGVGQPITGERFAYEVGVFGTHETLNPVYSLFNKFWLDKAAWMINCEPRFITLTGIVKKLRWPLLYDANLHISNYAAEIPVCREKLDELTASLESERNLILASSLLNLIAARSLDTQAANAAMAIHNELVSTLRSSMASLVSNIERISVELETCLTEARSNPLAIEATTGTASMPTEQMLSASRAMSEYAVELETQTCGPEFLKEVDTTHGRFSAEVSIPALSRFVELHNMLLATLSAESRLLAENLGNSAQGYMRTDAMAASVVTDLAADL
ncbi:MAG: hypothetical protein K2Q25_14620 [Mycobacteriaceae bacterium]|nr:hypothetical protein [Mycobacteriaceae bacterium]